MSTVNDVWKHIFKTIGYDGQIEILLSAKMIKDCRSSWKGVKNQFEPRLLCKHDKYEDMPDIFKQYNINLLSVNNGIYLLTKTSVYHYLVFNDNPVIEVERNNLSKVLQIGNSESSFIDNMRYSGIFERPEILNEKILFGSMLNGRHRCNFTVKLNQKDVVVAGSQFETDGCYESDNKILVIEAKSCKNITNFNIRQLYYPYRSLYDAKPGKEIVSIFINKDKSNVLHVWKFEFTNPLELTSIKCHYHIKYKLI